MQKFLSFFLIVLLFSNDVAAFCGFYVAKIPAKLINKSSQVIMVRDGKKTTITMANDYEGSAQDFAMVIPVPEVLTEENIKVVNQVIFDELDAYSAPRMAEYYDTNPCEEIRVYETMMSKAQLSVVEEKENIEMEVDDAVSIEASYTVGEYDILILSSTESDALQKWLISNGYKIPQNAQEVLTPYIKSNMKFFVVKVNLEEQAKTGFNNLRPIQITFNSDKYMLPIRLGMANAEATQDLILYHFSKTGTTECTNYRTVKIPTDVNVPTFVQDRFVDFYNDLFTRTWKKEGENIVMQEYAWDLSSSNFVKCDPCASTPPTLSMLQQAGVWWVQPKQNQQWNGSDYEGDVFFTRQHVRYDRENFPQDLMFQSTPQKQRFQGRYVITHAVKGELKCAEAKAYKKMVYNRRVNEMSLLANLTGWDLSKYAYYLKEFASNTSQTKADPKPEIINEVKPEIKNIEDDKEPPLELLEDASINMDLHSANQINDSLWPALTIDNKEQVLGKYQSSTMNWLYIMAMIFTSIIAVFIWFRERNS